MKKFILIISIFVISIFGIFYMLFYYEELEIKFDKKIKINLQQIKPKQQKTILKRNFKDDNISVFFKDTFTLLEYKPYIRKR